MAGSKVSLLPEVCCDRKARNPGADAPAARGDDEPSVPKLHAAKNKSAANPHRRTFRQTRSPSIFFGIHRSIIPPSRRVADGTFPGKRLLDPPIELGAQLWRVGIRDLPWKRLEIETVRLLIISRQEVGKWFGLQES
jgi:hypothetical protein